ncbi:uncharacterized protein [Malus domestica]|uniref:uncharacterized protein n=1 Tax=Malus domestica TaxID=3750 RepID=UPI003976C616
MITKRVGKVAYRLELPPELSKVHNVFHVSMLRHYVSDPSHVIPPQPLEINPDLTYDVEPVTLLDWKDKELRNKTICLVKWLYVILRTKFYKVGRLSQPVPRIFIMVVKRRIYS